MEWIADFFLHWMAFLAVFVLVHARMAYLKDYVGLMYVCTLLGTGLLAFYAALI